MRKRLYTTIRLPLYTVHRRGRRRMQLMDNTGIGSHPIPSSAAIVTNTHRHLTGRAKRRNPPCCACDSQVKMTSYPIAPVYQTNSHRLITTQRRSAAEVRMSFERKRYARHTRHYQLTCHNSMSNRVTRINSHISSLPSLSYLSRSLSRPDHHLTRHPLHTSLTHHERRSAIQGQAQEEPARRHLRARALHSPRVLRLLRRPQGQRSVRPSRKRSASLHGHEQETSQDAKVFDQLLAPKSQLGVVSYSTLLPHIYTLYPCTSYPPHHFLLQIALDPASCLTHSHCTS